MLALLPTSGLAHQTSSAEAAVMISGEMPLRQKGFGSSARAFGASLLHSFIRARRNEEKERTGWLADGRERERERERASETLCAWD